MFAELLLNSIEKQAKPAVVFNPKRCLRSRLNSNACDLCLSLCKKKALTLSGKKIVFTEDQCAGCMACVSSCPNDAFESGFDLSSLLLVLSGNVVDEPVVLSCGKTRRHANQITIPCIGILSESVLAALNSVASHPFYLDVYRCTDCNNSHVLNLMNERMQGIKTNVGQTSDLKIRYITVENFSEANPGQQRRFFLQMAQNSLVDLGGDALPVFVPSDKTEERDKELKKGAAMISRLLRQALDLLPQGAVQEKELLHSYFYTLKTNENCDLCPSCTGMCPTGALKRKNIDGGKQLDFNSAMCSGCGLCRDFCKNQALTLRQGCKDAPKNTCIISY